MSGSFEVLAHPCDGVGFTSNAMVFLEVFIQGPGRFTNIELFTVIARNLITYSAFLDGGGFVLGMY